ncbi:putative divalent heavy-metal cations transporter [Halalkaliarchaeum sp. AArc-CO]|uniref:ZIP family metal transporter n=1 Tax=unclassified Halalkaliarchaeum TaxID=2678344 RepID=UPI00217E15DD|nr:MULTISPECIES: ZIP family metal transporter [unclassified Halalkaliarchaeum]MDR5673268.1 ZIP family metal transporter [Halalkaliarchaeum sp. AArc-GB]UWG51772.1 putative divalent heavy-metal cations transporter [Halalkaliarchaeum sp. AArc-CO]
MTDLGTVILVTFLAGAATGVGALPVFFRTDVSHRTYDAALGLAAGVMVAASVFGLIVPGMEEGSLPVVVAGVFAGGAFLLVANRLIPHFHAQYRGLVGEGGADEAALTPTIRRAVLVGAAITLHNAPEGLAIGVGYASGLEEVALVLAIVIAIQNVPDGFAFAVPFGETGISRSKLLAYTTLSGVVPQVAAAVAGFLFVALFEGLFPFAAGVAAGAMLAVVFREMIPSSHGHGYADAATAAFLVGFALIVIVDTVVVT